ncbi:hypothetical protein [Kitasatospora purpeofusca]|uniref:hypothetical protein n=1 Tax=Kitasatospora purpeofusca TaxID=67352 RepID=UPI00382C6507
MSRIMKQPSASIPHLLERRLSPSRFGPYLAAAGTHAAAVDLYRWNMSASGAAYEALHLVEVVVRNAIHTELEAWHAKQGNGASWLTAPPPVLTSKAKDDLVKAEEQARRSIEKRCRRLRIAPVPAPNPDDVVAQLTFGFWRYMVARRYTHNLWLNAIRFSFPGAPNLQSVEKPLIQLHALRNRIAHLEPIHSEDLRARRREMLQIVGYVDPRVQSWFSTVERVQEAINTRP